MKFKLPKFNKKALSVATLKSSDQDDMRYWRTASMEERLNAIEINRQVAYGPDSVSARLQRILEIAPFTRR